MLGLRPAELMISEVTRITLVLNRVLVAPSLSPELLAGEVDVGMGDEVGVTETSLDLDVGEPVLDPVLDPSVLDPVLDPVLDLAAEVVTAAAVEVVIAAMLATVPKDEAAISTEAIEAIMAIEFPSDSVKKSFEVSQHPDPPVEPSGSLASGRLASQQ